MEAAFQSSPPCAAANFAAESFSAPIRPDNLVSLSVSDLRCFEAKEVIFRQGDKAADLFEVVQGAVMVLRSLSGDRRQILDIAGPGRIVGLTSADVHDCTAIALRGCVLRSLGRERHPLDPRRGSWIAEALFEEVHRLRDLATALGRKTALERLAGFLLALSAGDEGDRVDLVLPISRQEIADHLGLAIETVCRNLKQMKRQGLILIDGNHRVILLDKAALTRLAVGHLPKTAPRDVLLQA